MVDNLSDAVTVPPTWLDDTEWVMEAYYFPEQIVHKVWMKMGYDWFTNGEEVEDGNGGVHIDGDNIFYDDVNVVSDVDSNVFQDEV